MIVDPRARRLFDTGPTGPGDLAASPFRADRDRIVSSPFFARLGGVTQVISPGGSGLLVHNRLTHSLKVAQVARAIAERLAADDRYAALLEQAGRLRPGRGRGGRARPRPRATRRSGTSASGCWTGWPGSGSGCPTASRATPSRTGSSPAPRSAAQATIGLDLTAAVRAAIAEVPVDPPDATRDPHPRLMDPPPRGAAAPPDDPDGGSAEVRRVHRPRSTTCARPGRRSPAGSPTGSRPSRRR